MSDTIYFYQSESLFPCLHSVSSPSSHSLLRFPSTSPSFHNTSSVPSTAMDILHLIIIIIIIIIPFYTTSNQFFINSVVIQPSGWHLTVIPLGSCSLRIVLWFTTTYGGSLLPCDNTTNMLVTHIFSQPQIHTYFIGISYLAWEVTVQSGVIKTQEASSWSLLAISG
jgi:hypothetical protein